MSSYIRKNTPGRSDWFINDRFGMFIHFGLYSMAARHEWVKTYEKMSDEAYEKYFKNFDPDMFDAKEWARAAKAAGMKYAVLTTKHHEGFCLFDTKYTDYKITNTPFGRDLVKEYTDAFRAEGLKVGFYYSLIDWHHSEFTIDANHPMRDDPQALELNKKRDMKIYAEYMRNQVTELLTNYGKIDILWFDYSYPALPEYPQYQGKGKDDWEAEKLIATARSLQPDLLIDNRTGIEQDLTTPEQYQVSEWPRDKATGEPLLWEVCHTFSGSWGYYRDEASWKSPKMLIDTLCKTVACGGNLLMNVGPCARGYFDKRTVNALDAYSEWMKYNGRSIYGCTMAEPEFKAPDGTVLTQSEDGKSLYIHLINYPFGFVSMENIASRIKHIQFLHDASELLYDVGTPKDLAGENVMGNTAETIYIRIPTVKPDVLVPVIEILLK